MFLIYGTICGNIEIFHFDSSQILSDCNYSHKSGVRHIACNLVGTKIVFVDDSGLGYLFDPNSLNLIEIESFPPDCSRIFWDKKENHIFYAFGGDGVHIFIYSRNSIRGESISKYGPLDIDADGEISMTPHVYSFDSDLLPILAFGGEYTCLRKSDSKIIFSYSDFASDRKDSSNNYEVQFVSNLAVQKLDIAWKYALLVNSTPYFKALANKCFEVMNLDLAIEVFRHLSNAGMVALIENINQYEDKNILAGKIAMLFMDYDLAQQHFLSSTSPLMALQMRKDLRDWQEALKLSETLYPQVEADISIEYAKELQFLGNYKGALLNFEKALTKLDVNKKDKYSRKKRICMEGIAKASIFLGNLNRGLRLVQEIDSADLNRECGQILESLGEVSQAAFLYEKALDLEKAGSLYINSENIKEASRLLESISPCPLHSKFGALCEKLGDNQKAVISYEFAGNMTDAIRLSLHKLSDPQNALRIMRKEKHYDVPFEVYNMFSEYFKATGDMGKAIEFLMLEKKENEAYLYAKENNCIELFVDHIGTNISKVNAEEVATYFEKAGNATKSAKYFEIAEMYDKSLELLLQEGDSKLSEAIKLVGKSKNEDLIAHLIDYLMGDIDGKPKEPIYAYQLYLVMDDYKEAAKTAILIAEQESVIGKYSEARDILRRSIREIESRGIHVMRNLRLMFVLLHSYWLVRILARRGRNEDSSRMLLRIAQNLSYFPKNKVEILITTIIQCRKSGFGVRKSLISSDNIIFLFFRVQYNSTSLFVACITKPIFLCRTITI